MMNYKASFITIVSAQGMDAGSLKKETGNTYIVPCPVFCHYSSSIGQKQEGKVGKDVHFAGQLL